METLQTHENSGSVTSGAGWRSDHDVFFLSLAAISGWYSARRGTNKRTRSADEALKCHHHFSAREIKFTFTHCWRLTSVFPPLRSIPEGGANETEGVKALGNDPELPGFVCAFSGVEGECSAFLPRHFSLHVVEMLERKHKTDKAATLSAPRPQ